VREAHALRLEFRGQTEVGYNSVFSWLLRQNQAFQSQNEAKASTPCKNTHSQKWKRASKQEKTSES